MPARLVRGRVPWHVTILGAVLEWLQWPRSAVVLVLLPGALLLAMEVRARRRRGPAIGVVAQPG